MAKMIKCKTCGTDMAKSAKVCPKCGAKNKKTPVALIVIAVILVIIIIAATAGGGNEPKKVSEVPVSDSPTSNGTPEISKEPEKTSFGIGETVELNNVRATLISVESNLGKDFLTPTDGNVFVVCEFEIENETSRDIVVSSMMSFNAYFDEYAANLSISAMTSVDTAQLDGTVAAGKKIKGIVGYEAPEDWKEMEIHYSPSFWGNKEIVFTATHK